MCAGLFFVELWIFQGCQPRGSVYTCCMDTPTKHIGARSLGYDRPAGASRILPVKMPEDLRADIEQAARAAGLTTSEWIRRKLGACAKRAARG